MLLKAKCKHLNLLFPNSEAPLKYIIYLITTVHPYREYLPRHVLYDQSLQQGLHHFPQYNLSTIPGNECCNLLSIFNQLNSYTFTDSTVWLFGLNTSEKA
jgi:hypothetical protein